jgi:PEP-CTERM motif-containing protein
MKLTVALLGLGLALLSGHASAFLIDNPYDSFGFNWSYFEGEYDLTGTGMMTVAAITDTSLTLQFSLTNNTSDANARLTAFGFDIDPDATAVKFFGAPSDGMGSAALNSIPSLNGIEVCAFGGVSCPGGATGGIAGNGANDIFSLKLTGDFANGARIDLLGYEYQTGDGPYQFSCSTTTDQCSGGRTVPEPGTLALVGVAVAGLSFLRRGQT